ncbi:MAG: aminotransferase class V-fold PLP-dependent enzyme [Gammaproteobacteria bacterium]|nr:aminotransferase class V-fold PLP-dependent enzyme [Gammaproteobacteria bacterium]
MRQIYLDYAATTPVDDRVVRGMVDCMGIQGAFGNPGSTSHVKGWEAREKIDAARQQVADFLGVDPREIVFTSGATESNNLALKGVMEALKNKPRHLITLKTEHKAILDTCAFLEKQGVKVTYINVHKSGLIHWDEYESALQDSPSLVSVMWVNNETGVIQDIQRVSSLAKAAGAYVHVDAAQAAGKLDFSLRGLDIDLLSLSAHKVYGPKGVGALYVRRRPSVPLFPQMHGGGQENGLRSGTLPTHQIVGLGAALSLASLEFEKDHGRIVALNERLKSALLALPRVSINGENASRVPHILNVCIEGVDGEALIMALNGICVSQGSACTSATIQASHVLSSMGLSDQDAHSSIRFSLGRYTTAEEIEIVIQKLKAHVTELRALSPAWRASE